MKHPDAGGHRGAGLISEMDGCTTIFSESSRVLQARIAPVSLRSRDTALSDFAALLDRLSDAELQHGHLMAAERLAWRAAALRAGGVA